MANNICRHWARADAVVSGPGSFVITPDLDEFMAPATLGGAAPPLLGSEHAALPLRGALARLAHAMGTGGSVAASAGLPARVRHVEGSAARGRCLKVAGVNYFPPACPTASSSVAAALSPLMLPRVLHMTTQAQPDAYEAGPSWAWKHVSWGGQVRAKWLATAAPGDEDSIVSIHHCCQPISSLQLATSSRDAEPGSALRRRLKIKASTHGDDGKEGKEGKEVRVCASQEQLPIELWHVRHLRGSNGAGGACRPQHDASSFHMRLVTGKSAALG